MLEPELIFLTPDAGAGAGAYFFKNGCRMPEPKFFDPGCRMPEPEPIFRFAQHWTYHKSLSITISSLLFRSCHSLGGPSRIKRLDASVVEARMPKFD